jgi:hypothetical protein
VTNATPVNLVRVTILTIGVGTFTLGPAVSAFRGVEALVDGNTYSYSVQQGGNYEFGQGIFGAGDNTLTRGVIGSSNGNAPVNFAANAICVFPALAQDLQLPGPQGPQGTPGEPGTEGAVGPAGPGINMPVINYNGDHTAQVGDANSYLLFTNAADCTLTLPANVDVAIPVNTVIAVEAHAAGKVTIAGAAGVTVNSRGGVFSTAGQYATIQCKQVQANVWTVLGDLDV